MNLVLILARAAQAREIYTQYELAEGLPISSDAYVDYIAKMTDYQIDIHEIDAESRQIRGWFHRYDGGRRAAVFVAELKSEQNPGGVTWCEQRFVTVKEACHVLIDDSDTYTEALVPLVDKLIFKGSVIIAPESAEDIQSEVFAMVAALELLFPWELRPACKEAIERGELTEHDVALRFRVPERQVSWILSDNVHPALCEAHEDLQVILSTAPSSVSIKALRGG